MKQILRSKLALTLAAFLMIAAAILIPLSGNIIGTHAQAPTSTPFSSSFKMASCSDPSAIVTVIPSLHQGDKVSGTASLTSDDIGENTQGEDLVLTETNGPFTLTVTIDNSPQPVSFTAAANNDSLTACIKDGVDGPDDDQTATISGTITPAPTPTPSPSPTPTSIALKKKATPTVEPGGLITYTLTLTNTQSTGSTPLHDITLTDTPPSKFIKTIIAGPVFDVTPSPIDALVHCPKPTTLTVSCTIDNFKPGAVVTISFLAQVFIFAPLGQTITNTATAESSIIPAVSSTASTKIAKQPGLTLAQKHDLLDDAFKKDSVSLFFISLLDTVCPGKLCGEAIDTIGLFIDPGLQEEKMALEDPPDTNCTIAQPVVPPIPQVPQGFTARETNALQAMHRNLAHQIAFETAFLTSINRARTALAEKNKACEDKQLDAAEQDAAQLAELLEAEPQILDNVVNAFEAAEFSTIQITATEVRKAQNDIAAHGLPSRVVNLLRQLGVTSSIDINLIQRTLVGLNPNTVAALGGGEFPEVLSDQSVTNSALRAAEALEQFAQS